MKSKLYFDIISPFSYFYVKERHRLGDKLFVEPIPILLGGLLKAAKNVGPAEIEAKRTHTYQFCIWQAEKLGIPFRIPNHHPFMTVSAQRLLIQENADWQMVERAFEFIWLEGKDPNSAWSEFCSYLELDPNLPKPNDEAIKLKLIKNTEEAQLLGAFGVPTLALGNRVFWGLDTIDWVIDYLNRPAMFSEHSYIHAENLPNGLKIK